MNHNINRLVALMVGLTALSACEKDDTREEVEEQTEVVGQTAQVDDVTVAAKFARSETQIVRFRNKVGLFECTCYSERMGFDSTDECKDGIGLWAEETIDSYEACITEVYAGADEPPAGSIKLVECILKAGGSVSECFAGLDGEDDGHCTEEGVAQQKECMALIDSGLEGCLEYMEEAMGDEEFFAEHEEWSYSIFEESNACLQATLQ